MRALKQSWPITLGIILGVAVGVFLAKGIDHWNSPAFADGREGRKAASQHSETFRYAAKVIAPAVVNITTVQKVRMQVGGNRFAFDQDGLPFYIQPQIKEGMVPKGVGSGFIFDAKNGFILTNNHVVEGGDGFIVRLADKREVEAKVIGTDSQTDVAVLKIAANNLTAAELGNSDDGCEVGDWVLAVGNPFGLLEQTVTAGIISAKGRRGFGLANYEDFLQTDAAINMGNSGGPLVNLDGQVIGMNSAIYSKTGGYQGIGFAIPINQARKIADQLVRNGAVVRGWLGVNLRELTPDDYSRIKLDYGAMVDGVYFRSPAKGAGIIPGDILLKIDGKPVRNSNDIPAMVAEMKPGTEVGIEALTSKGEARTLRVQIGTQPKDWGIRKNSE
ncbi:MAG TPA: trypsin-like peptidase domain-containing protein [Planctomycetota bacterium]|nr:trypsin-like peptidase domain-containing protein [Planctomycetota bacterium]